jgi:glyoxylase-like metal-dependent hydrolase (beta-lactamase superfamily II)
MKNYIYIFLLLMACQSRSVKSSLPKPSRHFSLVGLSEGVWAAIHQDPGGHAICNAGIIDLGDKTMVMDPFMNPDAASDLKNAAEQLTGKPVSIVVNSHFHNDHIRGNQCFERASVISTAWTAARIRETATQELAWEKENAPALLDDTQKMLDSATGFHREELLMWLGYFEGMVQFNERIRLKFPDRTFSDSLWIRGTKRTVRLVEIRKGHTESDLVMFLPAERIMFTGDLLFNERHPWLGDGDPGHWAQQLETWISDTGVKQFIPGHGAPGDKEIVKRMLGYLRTMSAAASAIPSNSPDSVVVRTPIPPEYASWKFSRFFKPNLMYVFKRQQG